MKQNNKVEQSSGTGAERLAKVSAGAVTAAQIEAISLFRGLEPTQLASLCALFSAAEYQVGQVIVREGEPGRDLYLLASGSVEVVKTATGGRSAQLAVLSEGDFFGEIALLEETTRSATVRALEPCLLLCLDGDRLEDLHDIAPRVHMAVHIIAHQRLQQSADVQWPIQTV